jgi:hypothetical protein
MNSLWFKQNKFLLAFAVAFIVMFGYVGWLLWGRYDTYKQTQDNLNQKLTQLGLLENNNPSPLESNVTLGDENHKHVQEAQRSLNQLVLRNSTVRPQRFASAIEFAQHLRKTVRQMEDSTEKAKITVPDNFRFGFIRYATAVPDKKHGAQLLERLGRQLLVIQELTKLVVASGVEQVDAIKRTDIEPRPRGAALSEDALADPVVVHPQEHYMVMPFELQLTCSAKALQKLINCIATSEKFLVIRYVSVEPETLQRKPDAAETLTAEGAAVAETVTLLPVLDRPLRLRVVVRLDYIEVLTPKAAARATK